MITRVDKAANCLRIICKACYVQLAKAEMEGPGYSRVGGEDLVVSIKSVILKRQWDFLRQEFYLSLKYVNAGPARSAEVVSSILTKVGFVFFLS